MFVCFEIIERGQNTSSQDETRTIPKESHQNNPGK